ncbi:MAG: glycosyltransferase family 39 protein [Verrucomicrobiota bacterium JB023]|nr:glycosyltransferase family 39 protein [Verrucomicrobiota bacterium JB023]
MNHESSKLQKLFSPLGLTLLALLTLLPGLWNLPLIDRDEPRFAHATVEMIDRGEWVVPYFNDEYRFDKPPLTYWWMRANFAVFGINEFSSRLHSVQASWLTALAIYFFALRLGASRRGAFFAGAGWLTCLQVLIHSRMAVADLPLILFITLSASALHKIIREPEKRLPQTGWLALWLALGFLAKGPLAHLIPGLPLLILPLYFWWKGRKADDEETAELTEQRRQLWPAQKAFLLAIIPSFALVAIWGIPALIDTRGAYFGIGIGKHVVERGTGALNSRFFIPGLYYFIAIIPFLLPWSPLLPGTLKKGLRAGTLEVRFLLAWLLAPFLIFSFYATQLPHYILPGYPAFFLLLAVLPKASVDLGKLGKTFRAVAIGLPYLFGGLLILAGIMQSFSPHADGSLAGLVLAAGVLFAALARAGQLLSRVESLQLRPLVILTAVVVVTVTLAAQFARNAHLTIRLHELTGDLGPGRLEAAGYQEESLVWYYDDFDDKDVTGFLAKVKERELEPENSVLSVVQKKRWRIDEDSIWPLLTLQQVEPVDDETEDLIELFGRERIENAPVVSGWSPATSSWIELLVLKPE